MSHSALDTGVAFVGGGHGQLSRIGRKLATHTHRHCPLLLRRYLRREKFRQSASFRVPRVERLFQDVVDKFLAGRASANLVVIVKGNDCHPGGGGQLNHGVLVDPVDPRCSEVGGDAVERDRVRTAARAVTPFDHTDVAPRVGERSCGS